MDEMVCRMDSNHRWSAHEADALSELVAVGDLHCSYGLNSNPCALKAMRW